MSTKYDEIYAKIREIPFGRVVSYGDVAKAIGMPRGAQMVGWALGAMKGPNELPWQRVVNKAGRLSIVNRRVSRDVQKEWLVREGIEVAEDSEGYYLPNPPWHTF